MFVLLRGTVTLLSRRAVMANATPMATALPRCNAVLGGVRVLGDSLAGAAIPCTLLRVLLQRGITMRPTLVPSVEQGSLGKTLITSNEIDVVSGLKKVEDELDKIASSILKVERDIEATVEDRSKAAEKLAQIRANAAGRQDFAEAIAELKDSINYLSQKEQSLRDKEKSLREEKIRLLDERKSLLDDKKLIKRGNSAQLWSGEGSTCRRSLTSSYTCLICVGFSQGWRILTLSS